MKKTKLILSMLVMLVIGITSCEKEELSIDDKSEDNSAIKVVTFNANNGRASSVKPMLEFRDVDTFLATIERLESEAEAHDDDFLRRWGHLSDDAIDDKEDELGYNPDKPYNDFEKDYAGFSSLHSDIKTKEERWMNNDILDDNNDPDDHFILDDGIRSLLNETAQVKIGRSLYQMTRYGYVEVTNGDPNLLSDVSRFDARTFRTEDVAIYGEYYGSNDAFSDADNEGSGSGSGNGSGSGSGSGSGDTSECKTGLTNVTYYYTTDGRYRLKAKQKITRSASGGWLRSSIKAKTVHHKKKRGRWKRRRATITAQISGEAVNNYCQQSSQQFKSKTKRRRQVKVKIAAPRGSDFTYKTRNRQLKTVHKKGSGFVRERFLWN